MLLRPEEFGNDSFSFSCGHKTFWERRKRWRHGNHVIFLHEFSSNTNLKGPGECCVSRFHRCGMNGDLTVAPSTLIPFQTKTVLLRFQNDLRPHLSFSYRFRPSTLQRRSREKPHGSACPPSWTISFSGSLILPPGAVRWETLGTRLHLGYWSSGLAPGRVCLVTYVTVFSPSTLENGVFKSIVSKSLHSGSLSNGSVFNDRFRSCSVDESRIRRKTAPLD